VRKIKTPTFIQASREDHIAPWKTCYVGTQLFGGPIEFMLAASGHIAGVVNPPDAHKYCHWTNTSLPKSPEQWLKTATQHPGSWWPTWSTWLAQYGNGKVPARAPGSGKLKVIEPAPGSFVKVQAA
jgi:polyhydroxyalkanoate synthase